MQRQAGEDGVDGSVWRVGGIEEVVSPPQLLVRGLETRHGADPAAQVADRAPRLGREGKDAPEDGVDGVGDGQDLGEEVGVAEVLAKRVVLPRRLLPRISTADEVDENDAQRPHIVRGGAVLCEARRDAALALGAHVKRAAAPKVGAHAVARGEAKVGDLDAPAAVAAQDVFGLQVAVVHAHSVKVLDGTEDLVKHVLDERVHLSAGAGVRRVLGYRSAIARAWIGDVRLWRQIVALFLRDHLKQVAVGAVLEDDVDGRVPRVVEHAVQSHDVGVIRHHGVHENFTQLERTLPLIQADLVQALDGVVLGAMYPAGQVHDAVRAETERREKLQSSIGDQCARPMSMRSGGHSSLRSRTAE